ncbi:MAG: PadR family transcriptional regulator [Acidobacteria bacterium]|nr:PadR family transcriptional regulator [Acidobacteriota bacterium]
MKNQNKSDAIPPLSRKEAIILEMLIDSGGRELFGLEMVEASKGDLKRGTIYVTLQRMEEKGYIESRTEVRQQPEIGIPRRLYKVTGCGERVYNAYQLMRAALSPGFGSLIEEVA